MRIRIVKTFTANIDTNLERARITKAFKDDPQTQRHLLELMDAIEALDWKKAHKLVESKWWQGTDKEQGCSRLEFIGVPWRLGCVPIGFNSDCSYLDLIYAFIGYPHNYKACTHEP